MLTMNIAARSLLLATASGHARAPSLSQRGRQVVTRSLSSSIGGSDGRRVWKVYLSGEIHSDWREVIAEGVRSRDLPVSLSSPNTSHADSDDCGAIVLGMEEERRNWDRIGAGMNDLRTKTLIKDADIVVVRFGEKYRQWNAASTPDTRPLWGRA